MQTFRPGERDLERKKQSNQNSGLVLASGVDYTARMISIEKTVAVLASCFLLTPALHAVTDGFERDYRVIIDRNAFGLKPPPPPATNAPVVPPPKEDYFLTGISSIGGVKAYFMSKPSPTKKDPEYYSLGVDEKRDDLEVVGIDLKAQSVRVRSGGIESVMTFASHGVKPPASAPSVAPGTPGAPAAGTPGLRVSAVAPGGATTPTARLSPSAIPAAGGGVVPQLPGALSPAVTPATSPASRVRTIPSRNPRAPTDPAPVQQVPAMSAEQEALLMELQRAANPHIDFPPTPMPPMP
jgi:hypothetical protein